MSNRQNQGLVATIFDQTVELGSHSEEPEANFGFSLGCI
jgi:hypothetical protein